MHKGLSPESGRYGETRISYVADEDDYERVTELRTLGTPKAAIAHKLGMDKHSFYRLLARDPRMNTAYEAGDAVLEEELVGTLVARARKGEAAPLIFALKSMFGYTDRPVQVVDHRHRVTIEMPAALSPGAFKELGDGIEDAEVVKGEG